jgi:AcrR family transcriptional regulator
MNPILGGAETMSDAQVVYGRVLERPKPLYRQLQPRWCGLDSDEVEKNQRLRLIGAMVQVVGSDGGYASANIKLLSALAGVSRQTFYDRFGTIEACFLASYKYVVNRAARHVRVAFYAEETWEAKLRAAFEAYASEVLCEPEAARLALVEVLGAGPAALEERNRGKQVFERMLAVSFRECPGEIEISPVIAQAIVGGVERITRRRLLYGGVEQLPVLAEELLTWATSYNSPALAELAAIGTTTRRRSRPSAPWQHTSHRSDQDRILRSAARLAASEGYDHLTRWQIIHQSKVSERTFDALYGGPEECFLDALDLLGGEVLDCAADAAAEAEDFVGAVHEGITTLLDRLARDRVLQSIMFIEVFAVGPPGILRRARLLETFTDLLTRSLPEDQRPSELVAEAIVGAIWGILHRHITRGAGRLLPALAEHISYIALAPPIGAEAAVRGILADP